MAEHVKFGAKKTKISGDVLLAIAIAAGVVIGDFVLNNLPF
jgi:hypothetical protein